MEDIVNIIHIERQNCVPFCFFLHLLSCSGPGSETERHMTAVNAMKPAVSNLENAVCVFSPQLNYK